MTGSPRPPSLPVAIPPSASTPVGDVVTGHKVLSPIQSTYYAELIRSSDSPTLMAAVYESVTDDDLPRCCWWTRHHRWENNSTRGSVVTGHDTGRGFVCRRCRIGFSVGSLGYRRWTVGGAS